MPLLAASRPARSAAHSNRPPVVAVIAGCALLITLVPLRGAFAPAPTEALEVTNPTPFQVHVTVRSSDQDGGIGLGTVEPEGSHRFQRVLDQGETWIFAFDAAGVDAGELTLTRGQLTDHDWNIEIPASVATTLDRADVPPSP